MKENSGYIIDNFDTTATSNNGPKVATTETFPSLNIPPYDTSTTPSNKKQRKHALNFNTENTNTQMVCELYAQGKIDKKGWSLMSPALRKMCERYAAKKKRETKRK